jgi:hypothetical protein
LPLLFRTDGTSVIPNPSGSTPLETGVPDRLTDLEGEFRLCQNPSIPRRIRASVGPV